MKFVCFGLLTLAIAASRPSARQVFRSSTDQVLVNVRVTSKGNPVSGLTADDFRLWDDGIEQKLDLISVDAVPIDLFLLIDTGLVNDLRDPNRFLPQLRSVSKVMSRGDRLAVWYLANEVRPVTVLTEVSEQWAVPDTRIGGGVPPVFDGLALAMMQPAEPGRCRVIVVVTNGLDVTSISKRRLEALASKTDAPAFIAFQRSDGLDQVLTRTADLSSGAMIKAADAEDGVRRALEALRQGYMLSFTPSSKQTGWHPIKVGLKREIQAEVCNRPGYIRPN